MFQVHRSFPLQVLYICNKHVDKPLNPSRHIIILNITQVSMYTHICAHIFYKTKSRWMRPLTTVMTKVQMSGNNSNSNIEQFWALYRAWTRVRSAGDKEWTLQGKNRLRLRECELHVVQVRVWVWLRQREQSRWMKVWIRKKHRHASTFSLRLQTTGFLLTISTGFLLTISHQVMFFKARESVYFAYTHGVYFLKLVICPSYKI